jgi:hypothetical protein
LTASPGILSSLAIQTFVMKFSLHQYFLSSLLYFFISPHLRILKLLKYNWIIFCPYHQDQVIRSALKRNLPPYFKFIQMIVLKWSHYFINRMQITYSIQQFYNHLSAVSHQHKSEHRSEW